MSRSVRKTSIGPLCNASNKIFRSIENKKKRRKEKVVLNKDIENLENSLPLEKEFGNEWKSPRDGKSLYYTEDHVRKSLDATLKTILNRGNNDEWLVFGHNNYFDSFILDEFKKYTKIDNIKKLLKVSSEDINKFIKSIVKINLKK